MKEKIKNILEELNEIGEMSECEISEVLKKDGIKYSVYINGDACAEFCYGQWVDTSCYGTDSIEVNNYVE